MKERVPLMADIYVAYSFSLQSLPNKSVSRDWTRVTKACKELTIEAAEVMVTL